MCFRLFAAVRPVGPDAEELALRATALGLDVRVAPRGSTAFVEVAWGDCACSLYAGRSGRERAIALVGALLDAGHRVQLLLFVDGEPIPPSGGEATRCDRERFEREGLQALEEAVVTEIVGRRLLSETGR